MEEILFLNKKLKILRKKGRKKGSILLYSYYKIQLSLFYKFYIRDISLEYFTKSPWKKNWLFPLLCVFRCNFLTTTKNEIAPWTLLT